MTACGALIEFDALRNALDMCTSKLEWGVVRNNALVEHHANAGTMETIPGCLRQCVF
jgi:hypothetical protein